MAVVANTLFGRAATAEDAAGATFWAAGCGRFLAYGFTIDIMMMIAEQILILDTKDLLIRLFNRSEAGFRHAVMNIGEKGCFEIRCKQKPVRHLSRITRIL